MKSPLLRRLADRVILCPTRHPIDVVDRTRRTIQVGADHVEIWVHEVGPAKPEFDAFVLKFPGTGGRAECSTDQPACFLPDLRMQIWTVNPPGYGGSTGRACLPKLAPTAIAAFDALRTTAGKTPILVASNSLGGTSAMYLATQRTVSGLILRNPPPLRDVVMQRFGWPTLYLGAWLVASQVPQELNCRANANRITAPAIFVTSGRDRIVPPNCQRTIHEAYSGQKQVVVLDQGEHASPMTDEEVDEYRRSLQWLWSVVGQAEAKSKKGIDPKVDA